MARKIKGPKKQGREKFKNFVTKIGPIDNAETYEKLINRIIETLKRVEEMHTQKDGNTDITPELYTAYKDFQRDLLDKINVATLAEIKVQFAILTKEIANLSEEKDQNNTLLTSAKQKQEELEESLLEETKEGQEAQDEKTLKELKKVEAEITSLEGKISTISDELEEKEQKIKDLQQLFNKAKEMRILLVNKWDLTNFGEVAKILQQRLAELPTYKIDETDENIKKRERIKETIQFLKEKKLEDFYEEKTNVKKDKNEARQSLKKLNDMWVIFKTWEKQIKEQLKEFSSIHELIATLKRFGIEIEYNPEGNNYIVKNEERLRRVLGEIDFSYEEMKQIVQILEHYGQYGLSDNLTQGEITKDIIKNNTVLYSMENKLIALKTKQQLAKYELDEQKLKDNPGTEVALKKIPWYKRNVFDRIKLFFQLHITRLQEYGFKGLKEDLVMIIRGKKKPVGKRAKEPSNRKKTNREFSLGIKANPKQDIQIINRLLEELIEPEKMYYGGNIKFPIGILIELHERYKGKTKGQNHQAMKDVLRPWVTHWYNKQGRLTQENDDLTDREYIDHLVNGCLFYMYQSKLTLEDLEKYINKGDSGQQFSNGPELPPSGIREVVGKFFNGSGDRDE